MIYFLQMFLKNFKNEIVVSQEIEMNLNIL
jgi:hypothetical protein